MFYVALTGKREAGKTTVADYLVSQYGFIKIHPFDLGKGMCYTYYISLGIPNHLVQRMIYGDLKDTPCADLPNGVASRYFMEKFGYFMGVTMGPEWTLKPAMDLVSRIHPHANKFVIESLAYEESILEGTNHMIIRINRNETDDSGKGFHTDSGVDSIRSDRYYTIENNGSKQELYDTVDETLNLHNFINQEIKL